MTQALGAKLEKLDVAVYDIPTSEPESDGTFAWQKTTLVTVHAHAGGVIGLGYTYADAATARVIRDHLAPALNACEVMDIPKAWSAMVSAIRNIGRAGISSMAISAVDVALWDLKARLLGVPVLTLLGAARRAVPAYGSGGFTSMNIEQLQTQLGTWAELGMQAVKMKVGRHAQEDVARVTAARQAIGPDVDLFVDANGAYARKQALELGESFARLDVVWFEEPVSSDDLAGLNLLRDRAPAGLEIAAGEYGYDAFYFRRMLDSEAVDVLQADGTRCGGFTGFLQAAALCEGFGLPLSAHCAPSLHQHVCAASPRVRHLEYFYDHARIEQLLFDGAAVPVRGELKPDTSRPGLGLELKVRDAARFGV